MELLDWGITDHFVSNIKEYFVKEIDEAINHLMELGHRGIMFISGPLNLKTAKTRKIAFITSICKYSEFMTEPLIVEGDFRNEGGEFAVNKMFKSLERIPTAVLASNDLMVCLSNELLKESKKYLKMMLDSAF